MWRSTYLVKIFLIICFYLVVSSSHAVAEEPSIRFYETRYDFGSLKKGGKIVHDFEFINEGRGVLRIEKLIPA